MVSLFSSELHIFHKLDTVVILALHAASPLHNKHVTKMHLDQTQEKGCSLLPVVGGREPLEGPGAALAMIA